MVKHDKQVSSNRGITYIRLGKYEVLGLSKEVTYVRLDLDIRFGWVTYD
jgi:hypothetical protein